MTRRRAPAVEPGLLASEATDGDSRLHGKIAWHHLDANRITRARAWGFLTESNTGENPGTTIPPSRQEARSASDGYTDGDLVNIAERHGLGDVFPALALGAS